jgi:hypothetical protein
MHAHRIHVRARRQQRLEGAKVAAKARNHQRRPAYNVPHIIHSPAAKLDQLAYAQSRPRLQNRATVRPVHVRPDDPEGKTAQTRSSAHVVAPACGPGALLTRLLLSSAAAPRSRRKSATASWPQHLRACEPCRHRRLSCRPPFRRPHCPRDRPSPDSH